MIDITQAIALPGRALAAQPESAARDARFAGLVERQSRFVFRVAYALLRNSHDAEDAVQDTFLKLYRGSAWETIENERAFLARVAWRIAVDKLTKLRGAHQEPLDAEMALRCAASPEDAAVAANWNAAVHRLVDALPEDLRRPLALSTVEEMNSREIAYVMGIAEGTVRTRIMRARQVLKQKLAVLTEGRYEKR